MSFDQIRQLNKKIKSKRGSYRANLLSELFTVPQIDNIKIPKPESSSEVSMLRASIAEQQCDLQSERQSNIAMRKTVKLLKVTVKQKSICIKQLRKKLLLLNREMYNLKRKLVRRGGNANDTCGRKVRNTVNKVASKAEEKAAIVKNKLQEKKAESLKLKRQVTGLEQKCKSLGFVQERCLALEKENEGSVRKRDILKKQLDDVVIDNDYLQLLLSDNAPLELYDKDSHTFTPKAVHCIME